MRSVDVSVSTMTGKMIHLYRIWKGLSRIKVAEESNISQSYLYLIERGKKTPSIKTLTKIASSLDVSPSALMAEAEKAAKKNKDVPLSLFDLLLSIMEKTDVTLRRIEGLKD